MKLFFNFVKIKNCRIPTTALYSSLFIFHHINEKLHSRTDPFIFIIRHRGRNTGRLPRYHYFFQSPLIQFFPQDEIRQKTQSHIIFHQVNNCLGTPELNHISFRNSPLTAVFIKFFPQATSLRLHDASHADTLLPPSPYPLDFFLHPRRRRYDKPMLSYRFKNNMIFILMLFRIKNTYIDFIFFQRLYNRSAVH